MRPIGPLPTDVKPVTPDAPAVAAGALHWALPSTLATAHTWVSHLELRDLPIAPWTLVDPIAVPDQSPPTSAREKVMRLLWRWPEGETRARVLHGISVLECPPGAAANAVDPGSPAGAGRPKPTHGEFGRMARRTSRFEIDGGAIVVGTLLNVVYLVKRARGPVSADEVGRIADAVRTKVLESRQVAP